MPAEEEYDGCDGGLDVPPPDDVWLESFDWEDDSAAIAEVNTYKSKSDLDGQDNENKFVFKKTIGAWIPRFIGIIGIIIIATLLSYAFHMLTPESWHYLPESSVEKIDDIIFNGSIGAVLALIIQQYFMRSD